MSFRTGLSKELKAQIRELLAVHHAYCRAANEVNAAVSDIARHARTADEFYRGCDALTRQIPKQCAAIDGLQRWLEQLKEGE